METTYTWETTFNTSKSLMTHYFSCDVTVITDTKSKETKVYKKGVMIRALSCEMTCMEYTDLLISVAEDAAILKEFSK